MTQVAQQPRRTGVRDRNALRQQAQSTRIPTLGNPVYATQYVAPDVQGKWLGADADVNVAAGLFKSKEQGPITAAVAAYLNAQGGNPSGIPFTEDTETRIYLDPQGRGARVPGSQAFEQAASDPQNPQVYGRVEIRNPISTYQRQGSRSNRNRNGTFIAVGGPAWRQLVTSYLAGATPLSQDEGARLIGQAYRYGLARPMQEMGIQVEFTPNPAVTSGGTYRVSGLENVDMARIKEYYDQFLKNPDNVRKGRYGYASLARDFATDGYMTDAQGNPLTPEQVVQTFESTGSAKGLARWTKEYASSKSRAGLTNFPLRNADGSVYEGNDPNEAFCNLYGSGPGVTGNLDNVGARLYRSKHEHRTKSGNNPYGARASVERSSGAPTYYCGPTPAQYIDPSRSVYKVGGQRAGNVDLSTVLDARGTELGRMEQVGSAAQDRRYTQWSTSNAVPSLYRVPTGKPGRERKGGFALFEAAGTNPKADRARLYQERAANTNGLLPSGYKGNSNRGGPSAQQFTLRGTSAQQQPAAFQPQQTTGRMINVPSASTQQAFDPNTNPFV